MRRSARMRSDVDRGRSPQQGGLVSRVSSRARVPVMRQTRPIGPRGRRSAVPVCSFAIALDVAGRRAARCPDAGSPRGTRVASGRSSLTAPAIRPSPDRDGRSRRQSLFPCEFRSHDGECTPRELRSRAPGPRPALHFDLDRPGGGDRLEPDAIRGAGRGRAGLRAGRPRGLPPARPRPPRATALEPRGGTAGGALA